MFRSAGGRTGISKKLLLIGISLFLAILVIGEIYSTAPRGGATPPLPEKDLARAMSGKARQGVEPEQEFHRWTYSTSEDKLGRKLAFAFVSSTNTLNFGFPYEGAQHGTLSIRQSAQAGVDVILQIERGRFQCGIQTCAVNVRFDEGAIQRFAAAEPADRSSTMLFLQNQAEFLAQMRQAKVVRIEPTFFREGSPALSFDVEGFRSL